MSYLSEDDKLARAYQGTAASNYTWMVTHLGNPPNWVYTPIEHALARERRISEAKRRTMRITETTISSDPMPIASAPSPASSISVPASPSVPSSQASLISIAHSSDSASDLHADMAKLFRKQPGYSKRFEAWRASLHLLGPQTDLALTQRLCVFFHVEITGYLWNQASRVEAYETQDENLAIQHQYLVSDYAAIFSGHQYPRYIVDVSTCQQLVQDAERQSLEQRRGHLRRILASLKAENIAGNALLERLQPYLPGFDYLWAICGVS